MTTALHLDDERAQLLVEGLLPAAEAALAQGHLAACQGCRALVESHRALAEALSGLEAPEPPPGFTAGVLARVERRQRLASWERGLGVAILAASAAAAGALFAGAGQSAWADAVSGLLRSIGGIATALRIGGEVAGPVVSALRPQIVAACAAVALPLFFLLARLTPARRTESA
ncbi:MAG TPA: anti-sigma factor [Anaeromyxobacteraceae bacterium]|nr:anti-sigma factor [Anaeromyxobacteraceae bacterium]